MSSGPTPVRHLDTFLPPTPTLGECLAVAPPWYTELLRAHRGALPSTEDAHASLVQPERLAAVLAALDPLEKTAFWLVGTLNAGRGIPVEQCWAVLGEVTGQRHRRFQPTLDSLRRRGLVFVGHHDYRTVYFIPRDVRAAAEATFFRPVVAGTAQPADAYRSTGHPATAVRDLHLFLLAVTRGEIRLTRQGEIYRRQQIRFARMLGWPSWGPVDRPSPREDCLAARMSVLWEYALARHLIEDHPDGVRVAPALRTWTRLSWAERWLDMVELQMQRGAGWYHNLFTLLQMLLWAPPGRWLPLDATPLAGARPLAAPITQPVSQHARILEFLGILETVEAHDFSIRAVRLTPLGRAYLEAVFGGGEASFAGLLPEDESSFIVAPNFEVVAPFTLHPRILLQLGALADLAHADQALVFQITRASVYRALKRGMDGQTVLAVLEKGSQHPLPQNVQASIREWADAYGRVWLARFLLLRCADAETAARVKVLPRLQPYLAGELTPCDLILREGDPAAVCEILEREGFLPRAQLEMAPPRNGETPADGDQTGAVSPETPSAPCCGSRPPSRDWRSMLTARSRRRPEEISPGRAPSQPPIRVVPSDWFDLPGRR